MLGDRLCYFYNKIANNSKCQKDCQYSKYYIETNNLRCKCKVNDNSIDTEKINDTDLSVYSPEKSGYKYTSYKTMKCYKLVFSSKYIKKNAGSIILLIFILFHLIFLIYYIIRGITPLKKEISHLLLEEKDLNSNKDDIKIATPSLLFKENRLNEIKDKRDINSENEIKFIGFKDKSNPTRKIRGKRERLITDERKRKGENIKLIDIIVKKKKRTRLKKRKKKIFDEESLKSDKVVKRKRKTIADYLKERESKTIIGNTKKNLVESSNNTLFKKHKMGHIETNIEIKSSLKNNKNDNDNEKIILDDYELNNLKYDTAIEVDKRGFFKTYWSIIKREQSILFVFVSKKDFNLTYIKYARLIFTLSTLITMNTFLFSDESIHELFTNGIKYNFGKQVLQIVLAIIITHVMEILLCFLTMTDKIYYEIKSFSKSEKKIKDIFKKLKLVKLKLIIFLITSFILMIFYWYFISTFCSVYNNSQKIYIIDCVLSLLFFMIDPLFIYGFFTLLRIISLKYIEGKKYKCLYIISRIFQIF